MLIKFVHFCICFALLYTVVFSETFVKTWFLNVCGTFVLFHLAQWLMESTRMYISMKVPNNKRAVLITGCDSGFGNLLAKRIDSLGFHVFAACMQVNGPGAADLKTSCSSRLQIVEMDVTKDDSVGHAFDVVKENLKDNVLWAVVNNAGITQIGEIDWCPMSDFQNVMEINTMGILRVTKNFLPLVKKSQGRIVNICSHIGRKSYPGFVGYAMSKSAAISLTEGMKMEFKKWGIDVVGIEPYFYRTPMTDKKSVHDRLVDTWKRAPQNLKDVYGEEYMESYTNLVYRIVSLSSRRVQDVLECLEDAVTSIDPHSVYFPCKFSHKVFLRVVESLPYTVLNTMQTLYFNCYTMPRGSLDGEKHKKE